MNLISVLCILIVSAFTVKSAIHNTKSSGGDKIYYNSDADKCTTIVVAQKASVGGPMVTHTNDCLDCDFRISKVPAKDWPAGSMRPLSYCVAPILLRLQLIEEKRGG